MLRSKRPKIGITGPDLGGTASWLFTAMGIFLQGGIPVHITPSAPRSMDELDGLIISGGADVDPQTYEDASFIDRYTEDTLLEIRISFWRRTLIFLRRFLYSIVLMIRRLLSRRRRKVVFGLDKARDRLEFQLLDEAVKRNLPVLGVCRGMQLINIYFKGNLYQEIKPFYIEEVNRSSILPFKRVFVRRGSKLYHIVHSHTLKVNALHHQAVREPGAGIEIAAWESNGLVQAIESTRYDFIIGVQWHPEYLVERKRQRWIYKALVKQAREKRGRG